MADVFISYHVKSASTVVRSISEQLEKRGISCWYSDTGVLGGEDFARTVPPEIASCRVFLLILDEGAAQSPHVESELGLAFKRKNEIKIIPFRTEKCPLSDWMQYYFVHIQIMNPHVKPPLEDRILELIFRVEKVVQDYRAKEEAARQEAERKAREEAARQWSVRCFRLEENPSPHAVPESE